MPQACAAWLSRHAPPPLPGLGFQGGVSSGSRALFVHGETGTAPVCGGRSGPAQHRSLQSPCLPDSALAGRNGSLGQLRQLRPRLQEEMVVCGLG